MARPKKEAFQKRTQVLKVLLTIEEHNRLNRLCNKTHMNLSEFSRALLFKKEPIFDKSTLESYNKTIKLLTNISGNINQISKALNGILAGNKGLNLSEQQRKDVADVNELLRLFERNKASFIQTPA